jgi:hypothetical protein
MQDVISSPAEQEKIPRSMLLHFSYMPVEALGELFSPLLQ